MSDGPPVIEERYARAVRSSHLTVPHDHRITCDVDKLIAAGWVRGGLGTTLYRLRVEFDAVRADQQRLGAQLDARKSDVRQAPQKRPPQATVERRAGETLSDFRERQHRAREAADQPTREEMAKAIAREALTARLLILLQLKTLNRAKGELAEYALSCTRARGALSDGDTEIIAGQVLDVWLDPLCHHCDGRGFNGGSHRGEVQVICRPCRGCGHRMEWIGRTLEEQAFAQYLFTEVGRMLGIVGGQMRRFLRQRDEIT